MTLNAPEIKIDDTTTTEDVAAAEIKEEKVEEKEDIIEEVMDNSWQEIFWLKRFFFFLSQEITQVDENDNIEKADYDKKAREIVYKDSTLDSSTMDKAYAAPRGYLALF